MAKLQGAKGGGSPAPKGGGKIVSTTRNGSMMAQSKGQMKDVKGPDIGSASTPSKSGPKSSGGSKGSAPSLGKTFAGADRAGDAGSGLGGSRKLGNHYSNG